MMNKEENSFKKETEKNRKGNHNKAHHIHIQYDTSEQMGGIKFKHRKPNNVNKEGFPIKRLRDVKSSQDNNSSNGHATPLRKRVDPETAKYFLEIANLFESNAVDMDVRPTVCGNALEETRGKEMELATDMIVSRTLQCLLEGCDLEQLCSFLRSSAEQFSSMAVDKFGSHVAETALKSLAVHLQDDQSYLMVEEALHKICQVVGADVVNIMCSSYGSHVLRSLLCLCTGVALDALEGFHVTKPSTILADRLSCVPAQPGVNNLRNIQNGFPETFNFLVQEILNHAKDEISCLRVEKYSSFVLQSMLKLLAGNDQLLLHAILILLGCQEESFVENRFTDATKQKLEGEILVWIEDASSSHLLEVIVEVAPEVLYNELLGVIFRGPELQISSHQFGNFIVQALVSSAKTKEHVNLIWEKLGPHLYVLLEAGKPGVVASILAACQRLQTHVDEFCQALSVAACSESTSPAGVVPHLLHLDSYFRVKPHWNWPVGDKMNVLGCLMLQSVFKSSNSAARPYIASVTSMEADHILETVKDVGGGRVLEAFLCSDASTKQKLEVITKLHGHFGELSLHPSGSFTVEKCFISSTIPMKEAIAAEVLNVQPELSKTRHGPHLLRKLDIEGFARNPEQWKSRHESKAMAYRDYQATFGDKSQAAIETPKSSPEFSGKKRKKQEKVTEKCVARIENNSSRTFPAAGKPQFISGGKHRNKRPSSLGSKSVKFDTGKSFIRNNMKSQHVMKPDTKRSNSELADLADLARKSKLSRGDVQSLFDPKTSGDRKQQGTPFLRKHHMRR